MAKGKPSKPHLAYEARLQATYLKLTFRHQPTDQDIRREQLFRRLVLHHLLQHNMYTIFDWRDLAAQQTCVFNFLQSYAKQLWPGSRANRQHLSHPELHSRGTRSFIGAVDSHWSQKRNGPVKETEGAFGQRTEIGGMALSKVGKAVTKYVDVLMEPGLMNAEVEDTEKLIGGIVATEMGPEIPVKVMEEEMVIKLEDDSDF